MHINTHLDIGKLVAEIVNEHAPIRLDSAAFMLGNIKPDLSPDYYLDPHKEREIKVGHFQDHAMPFLMNEIQNLLGYSPLFPESAPFHYAMKLGSIMHYFSDFFCYVHTPKYSGNMFMHHVYEFGLSHEIMTNRSYYEQLELNPELSEYTHPLDLCEHFQEILHIYYQSQQSMNTDLTFAIEFCSLLSLSITEALCNRRLAIVA